MFPGTDTAHQLDLIVSVLGTQQTEDVEEIELKSYIQSKGNKKKINFESLFPNASPLAIDLLEKLLRFDP